MPEISDLLLRPPPERFDGAAAWAKLPPEVQAEIGAIALEVVAAGQAQVSVEFDETHAPLARAGDRAALELNNALAVKAHLALGSECYFGADGQTPRIPSFLGGACRVCGCSQNDACDVGCGWAAEDLCTACVEGEEHDHG